VTILTVLWSRHHNRAYHRRALVSSIMLVLLSVDSSIDKQWRTARSWISVDCIARLEPRDGGPSKAPVIRTESALIGQTWVMVWKEPRLGAIFILIQKGKQASTSPPYLVVINWSRVGGQVQREKRRCNYPLLAFWQILRLFQKLGRFLDRIQNLALQCAVHFQNVHASAYLEKDNEYLSTPF
jgi:hypothetical protein